MRKVDREELNSPVKTSHGYDAFLNCPDDLRDSGKSRDLEARKTYPITFEPVWFGTFVEVVSQRNTKEVALKFPRVNNSVQIRTFYVFGSAFLFLRPIQLVVILEAGKQEKRKVR